MNFTTWMSFATMILFATAAPGPNILVVILTQITSGFRGVFWAILGNLSANAIITLFAVLGSHTLIEAGGEELVFAYSLIGGLFLCFLGMQTIRGAAESSLRLTERTLGLSVVKENGTNAVKAFLTTFTNPKVILFQSIILPQFLNFETPILSQYLIMMATICVSIFTVHSAYACFSNIALNRFKSSNDTATKKLIYFSGLIFLIFGLSILANILL